MKAGRLSPAKENDMWKQAYFEIAKNADGTFDLTTNDPMWKDYEKRGCKDLYLSMRSISEELMEHGIDANFYFADLSE